MDMNSQIRESVRFLEGLEGGLFQLEMPLSS